MVAFIEEKIEQIRCDLEAAIEKLDKADDVVPDPHHGVQRNYLESMIEKVNKYIHQQKEQDHLDRSMEIKKTFEFMKNIGM